ncbi:MAG: hypothetical protein KAT58_10645 [candidate division Zixibacteria bacterium]|nr:hypothetical protein [candidate division Zixibacteria bacterium]
MADFVAVIGLTVIVLMIFAWYRVIGKMGFPSWYLVLLLIPLVGPCLFLYFAFAEWPIERELAQYKLEARMSQNRAQTEENLPSPVNALAQKQSPT